MFYASMYCIHKTLYTILFNNLFRILIFVYKTSKLSIKLVPKGFF